MYVAYACGHLQLRLAVFDTENVGLVMYWPEKKKFIGTMEMVEKLLNELAAIDPNWKLEKINALR